MPQPTGKYDLTIGDQKTPALNARNVASSLHILGERRSLYVVVKGYVVGLHGLWAFVMGWQL